MIQTQGVAGRELDRVNPRYDALRKDFERFAFELGVALAANPANALRVTHIGHLNSWRNYAAHHRTVAPAAGGPLTLVAVRSWEDSCDGLSAELDGIMYNRLRAATGAPPW